MGRKILAIVVALIAAFGIMMIVEMINTYQIAPPPPEIYNDRERLRAFMAAGPASAYLVVLVGYILAAFAGGFVATKISRQVSQGPTLAMIIGGILTLGAILNIFVMLPGQPMWFAVLSLISFIPVAYLGYRTAR